SVDSKYHQAQLSSCWDGGSSLRSIHLDIYHTAFRGKRQPGSGAGAKHAAVAYPFDVEQVWIIAERNVCRRHFAVPVHEYRSVEVLPLSCSGYIWSDVDHQRTILLMIGGSVLVVIIIVIILLFIRLIILLQLILRTGSANWRTRLRDRRLYYIGPGDLTRCRHYHSGCRSR